MRLKPGVRILGVKTEILIAIIVTERAFRPNELVITSITEGSHVRGSEHYTGNAFDCRIRDMSEVRAKEIAHQIGSNLGADFDVIMETDHMHIEFDPKTPY